MATEFARFFASGAIRAPEMPRWVVNRAQARQVAAELGRRRRLRSVGVTAVAGRHGAESSGKTTADEALAEMV
ncbi:hypothetical protein [Streptomyces bottropensis]|uniref:hypothetical protein n=1 Tax=Streptomyces bottropensis TaxID=42235 RepID=UPI0036AA5A7B